MKMSAARGHVIIEALSLDEVFTEAEKEMIITFHENRIMRGTDEYRMARKLAEKREQTRGDVDVIE
ncbi:hypothetical protein [Falsiphaeobacter marinintestinus]|uniref:hypothetical protein n=1 Tax=Falsiphaeobacter marinintestinus TaxID=1492905 RepID=UPI0011B67056|nr:hypothetical protein [Phaeobacter marinintestinus]